MSQPPDQFLFDFWADAASRPEADLMEAYRRICERVSEQNQKTTNPNQ